MAEAPAGQAVSHLPVEPRELLRRRLPRDDLGAEPRRSLRGNGHRRPSNVLFPQPTAGLPA